MNDSVTLFSEPLPLLFLAGPPDEREPGKQVVYTELDGKTIARRALADARDMRQFFEMGSPLPLMYVGWEADPGIQAQLFALVPSQGEEWKGEDASFDALYLGTVVRARECRVAPNDLEKETAHHFAAILGGQTVEPIEQILKEAGVRKRTSSRHRRFQWRSASGDSRTPASRAAALGQWRSPVFRV